MKLERHWFIRKGTLGEAYIAMPVTPKPKEVGWLDGLFACLLVGWVVWFGWLCRKG